jgi:hypothetical protein
MKGQSYLFYIVPSIFVLILSNGGSDAFMQTDLSKQFQISPPGQQCSTSLSNKQEAISSMLPLQPNLIVMEKTRRLVQVGSTVQNEQELVSYQENVEPKNVISRRRAMHKGTTRMLTILATAMGVSRRFVPKVYAIGETLGGNVTMFKNEMDLIDE